MESLIVLVSGNGLAPSWIKTISQGLSIALKQFLTDSVRVFPPLTIPITFLKPYLFIISFRRSMDSASTAIIIPLIYLAAARTSSEYAIKGLPPNSTKGFFSLDFSIFPEPAAGIIATVFTPLILLFITLPLRMGGVHPAPFYRHFLF